MLRTYKNKNDCADIFECDTFKAMHEVIKNNMSIREVARLHNIAKSTLYNWVQKA